MVLVFRLVYEPRRKPAGSATRRQAHRHLSEYLSAPINGWVNYKTSMTPWGSPSGLQAAFPGGFVPSFWDRCTTPPADRSCATLNITQRDVWIMPTNLAIDDKLIEQARRIGQHRTKKEAVTAALS